MIRNVEKSNYHTFFSKTQKTDFNLKIPFWVWVVWGWTPLVKSIIILFEI